MKKIMNFFVLVAAAVMALVSCQKNEIEGPVKQEVHFTINAGISTKTIINDNGDGTYTPSWTGDEKLGVLFSAPASESDVVVEFDNTSEAGGTASFKGSTTVEGTTGTFYSFYPASAYGRGFGEGDARLDLEAEQKPSATSFDPSCDILVAKPYDYEVNDGQVEVDELYFKRLMSVLRIDLNTDFEDVKNEFVESVSFTAGDVQIVGYARVFLDNPDFTTQKWSVSGSQYCTVTARYDTDVVSVAGTDNSVYLVIAPVTIPAGKELTFEIKTKNYNISKTVTVPAAMKFAAGNVNKINLTIEEENCEAVDTSIDYSGDWLMAGKEGETWYAAKKYVSGTYLSVTALEFEGESILESDGLSDSYMHIEKVVGGAYDGMYTIMDAGGKYLSTSSKDNNNMKAVEVEGLDDNSYWSIEANDDGETFTIVATKSSNRNHMRFNYNGGTNSRVSCYQSTNTTQPCLKLFSKSLVKADETPRIIVADEDLTQNVAADATELTFDYDVRNITGTPTVTVVSEPVPTMTVTSATAAGGKVTVTFEENEETSSKSATITLSYEGATPVNVVITQAAKAAAGAAYYEKVTSEPADWSGTYLIVYETNSVAFDGSLATLDAAGNTISVEIADNKISATAELANSVFVIAKNEDVYSIQSASGIYIGRTAYGNDIDESKTTKYPNTLSLDSGNIVIGGTVTGSGQCKIRFNNDSGQKRFRYYKSGQEDIQLYRLVDGGGSGEGGSTPEPVLQERNLEFSESTATATVGEDFTEPTLSGAKDGVVYSSSDDAVAEVDSETGEVTLKAAGTTTIKAAAPADATYKAGEASYTLTVSAGGGSTEPDDSEIVTTTYTFTSKSWADATNSWKSGMDGNMYTSGQGVQVTSGKTGANATCKTSLNKVSQVEISYCTNNKSGKGTITVTIGSTEKSFNVVAPSSGGQTLKTATLDFSSELPTGTPKITVTCTTNSVYINALTFTHTN